MMTRLVSPVRKSMLGAAALMGFHACQDVSITAVDVASIEVTPAQGALRAGESLQLDVTVRDVEGNVLQERPVVWSSEDGSIAAVGDAGLVVAQAAGETRIRASSGKAEATATITVSNPPRIDVSESTLRFEAEAGEGHTAYTSIDVTAADGEDISDLSVSVRYADGEPTGWLDAGLQGKETPTTLQARATARDLEEGVYEAEVRIGSEDAPEPRIVGVIFAVDAQAPAIRLSTATITFERMEGQSAPSPRSVEITNDGGGQITGLQTSVSYASGQPGGWLSVSLAASTAPTTLALSVGSTSPPPGTYEATVRVSSSVAENSPRSLTVMLTVASPSVSASRSEVTADPGEIDADGESTSTVTVRLRDSNGNSIAPSGASVTLTTTRGTLSQVTGQGGGRYTATLRSSNTPGTATVTARVDGATLDERATVRFEAVDTPSSSVVSVASITYGTAGGPDENRNLMITVRLVNGQGGAVADAHVTAKVTSVLLKASGERSGTTDDKGEVVLRVSNFREGCYFTEITEVSASGLTWDQATPANEYCSD